jgi:hypothetical protein
VRRAHRLLPEATLILCTWRNRLSVTVSGFDWLLSGNAIDYAKFYSRSRDAVIHVYDEAGNVIETHEHTGEFKEW